MTNPQIARIRKTIKTVADDVEAAIEDPSASDKGTWFLAGVFVGLGAASRVAAGDSATKAVEMVEQAMYAAVGKALLDGKLSPADLVKEQPDA